MHNILRYLFFMEEFMYIYPYYNLKNINLYGNMNNEITYAKMMRCYYQRNSFKKDFTIEEAAWVAKYSNIKFDKFDVKQFRNGLNIELEHGSINPFTNVTNDDPILTGKIALAHLNEFPDYYKRLYKMEEEAETYLGVK